MKGMWLGIGNFDSQDNVPCFVFLHNPLCRILFDLGHELSGCAVSWFASGTNEILSLDSHAFFTSDVQAGATRVGLMLTVVGVVQFRVCRFFPPSAEGNLPLFLVKTFYRHDVALFPRMVLSWCKEFILYEDVPCSASEQNSDTTVVPSQDWQSHPADNWACISMS